MTFARGRRRWALAAALAVAVALAAAVVAARRHDPAPPLHEPAGAWLPSGPAGDAVVWAVGDGADGGSAAKAVVARIAAGHPDRLLYLGDVYGGTIEGAVRGDGTADDYRDAYATTYGRLASRTAPTPGNHEWPQRGDGYEPYWRRITGTTPPAYYAFTSGGWKLLSLNSEAPHGAGSRQVRWLQRELRAPGTCRLAFWHRPRFSIGRHGDQADVAPLFDALRGHAVLAVSGHDHNMQRYRPVGGVTQVVSGAGGHEHYGLHREARLAFGDDADYGALRIDLRPGRARLRFVAADGRVLDDSTVRCRQRARA
ncbi:MAG TPA: metallophosphoesterase [Solirubrobacteraceae bacterium]|nr:metallophosphoesterase [Solirubrobacteraceae bacterium]